MTFSENDSEIENEQQEMYYRQYLGIPGSCSKTQQAAKPSSSVSSVKEMAKKLNMSGGSEDDNKKNTKTNNGKSKNNADKVNQENEENEENIYCTIPGVDMCKVESLVDGFNLFYRSPNEVKNKGSNSTSTTKPKNPHLCEKEEGDVPLEQIDDYLAKTRHQVIENNTSYDSTSFQDFQHAMSEAIKFHFFDDDCCDSMASASSYSGYTHEGDTVASQKAVMLEENSLMSEASVNRLKGSIARKKKSSSDSSRKESTCSSKSSSRPPQRRPRTSSQQASSTISRGGGRSRCSDSRKSDVRFHINHDDNSIISDSSFRPTPPNRKLEFRKKGDSEQPAVGNKENKSHLAPPQKEQALHEDNHQEEAKPQPETSPQTSELEAAWHQDYNYHEPQPQRVAGDESPQNLTLIMERLDQTGDAGIVLAELQTLAPELYNVLLAKLEKKRQTEDPIISPMEASMDPSTLSAPSTHDVSTSITSAGMSIPSRHISPSKAKAGVTPERKYWSDTSKEDEPAHPEKQSYPVSDQRVFHMEMSPATSPGMKQGQRPRIDSLISDSSTSVASDFVLRDELLDVQSDDVSYSARTTSMDGSSGRLQYQDVDQAAAKEISRPVDDLDDMIEHYLSGRIENLSHEEQQAISVLNELEEAQARADRDTSIVSACHSEATQQASTPPKKDARPNNNVQNVMCEKSRALIHRIQRKRRALIQKAKNEDHHNQEKASSVRDDSHSNDHECQNKTPSPNRHKLDNQNNQDEYEDYSQTKEQDESSIFLNLYEDNEEVEAEAGNPSSYPKNEGDEKAPFDENMLVEFLTRRPSPAPSPLDATRKRIMRIKARRNKYRQQGSNDSMLFPLRVAMDEQPIDSFDVASTTESNCSNASTKKQYPSEFRKKSRFPNIVRDPSYERMASRDNSLVASDDIFETMAPSSSEPQSPIRDYRSDLQQNLDDQSDAPEVTEKNRSFNVSLHVTTEFDGVGDDYSDSFDDIVSRQQFSTAESEEQEESGREIIVKMRKSSPTSVMDVFNTYETPEKVPAKRRPTGFNFIDDEERDPVFVDEDEIANSFLEQGTQDSPVEANFLSPTQFEC